MKFPFTRKQREQELDEEIGNHLKMAARDRQERGESAEQAARSARREIGNTAIVKETTRNMWGWASLERLWQDLRYGLRILLKSPGFTIVAVLSLALGIGANTAIFSVVDKVLLRSLPVEHPERLFILGTNTRSGVTTDFSYPAFKDYRDRNDAFDGLICFFQTPFSLSHGGETERIQGLLVSGNYFSMLRVNPALGRDFATEEDKTPGTHPVVVLSHGFWQRRYGADPKIVGKTISLNEYGFTVVGIAPSEFTGTIQGFSPDVYVPVMMEEKAEPDWSLDPLFGENSRRFNWLTLMGRLKSGVTPEKAEAAMNVLGEQIAREHSSSNDRARTPETFVLTNGSQGDTGGLKDLRFPLKLLMALVTLVLFIACANVANLLLARSGSRQKEMAIRMAIGGGRFRLIRQLLTESILLSALGGIAGLVFGVIITQLLIGFAPVNGQISLAQVKPDVRAFGFTLLLSLLTGIVFGLAPAFSASSPDLVPALKDETSWLGKGIRRYNARNLLVTIQVALSVIVLVGAGLCVRSLQKLQAINAGFDPARILSVSIDPGLNGYNEQRGRQFYTESIERVSAVPGVESVSFALELPLGGRGRAWQSKVEGYRPQPGESMVFDVNVVGPEYFRTLKIPVINGREFTSADTAAGKKVAIINESVARRYFPNQNPIGRHLIQSSSQQQEIVGIVKDSKYRSLTEETRPSIYVPVEQLYQSHMAMVIRTANDPRATVATVRQVVQSIDPNLPIYEVKTLEEQKSDSIYTSRLTASLLTGLGLLVLALAAVGIYGVMSYSVNRRTRELGIRMALGAQRHDVIRMVILEGMTTVIAGLVLGTAGAVACKKLIASFLYGVSATDSVTFIAIGFLMAAVALLANYLPARTAVKVDPMVALRYE